MKKIKRIANKFIQPTPNSRFSFSFRRLWRGRLMTALAVVKKMDQEYKYTYQKLHKIYKKYQRRYKNIDSKQMCCMWSTKNPPDEIYETDQFSDIETVFDIDIGEDNALEIYDMNLDEATKKIIELKKYQHSLLSKIGFKTEAPNR